MLKDLIEIYALLPQEVQYSLNRWGEDKIGCTIDHIIALQKFASEKVRTRKIKFPEDAVEFFHHLPETWQNFLNQAISEKAGFDIIITENIQDFLIEKSKQQEFDLLEDSLELYKRLPDDWQEFIQRRIQEKSGINVLFLLDIQEFFIKKSKEKKFNLLEDSLELIQLLPDDWKNTINRFIAEKTGLNEKWISYCWNISKLNNIRLNPAEMISTQIETFISKHIQYIPLKNYVDVKQLSEIIVSMLNIIGIIFTNQSAGNNEKLGEAFQKLLLSISNMVQSSKERLIQMGGQKILDSLSDINVTIDVFEIDDWIKNSGLNITIEDLLEKINSEHVDEQFSSEDIENIGQLFSMTIRSLSTNEEFSNKIEALFSSPPVVINFLHDKDSIRKFTTLLTYVNTNQSDLNYKQFSQLAQNLIVDVKRKLYIAPEIILDSNAKIFSEASALGDWLYENGLSFEHFKKLGLNASVIKIIVRGWYLSTIYNKEKIHKKEPFAVKVSTMLASAHLISNLPAIMQVVTQMPPTRFDFASLGMSVKYGIAAFTEYAKRDKQIQNDLDDKLTSLYRNSLRLYHPPNF
ncbi:MAG: hypothetical protein HQK77_15340 [Desulfobacterales bacterium]|nr:hypothetical protein [Desulfobacterales bacterium]